MNIVKHAEGVYEIERFLDEEHRNSLLSKAIGNVHDPMRHKGWNVTHPGNTEKYMGEELFFKMQPIYKNIETFFINIDSIIYSPNLKRLRDSEFMWPHTDGGNPDDPKKIVFGVAIYLNDDFEGGELIYPDLGLSVTPKRGNMVIHDASLKHQVFPVTSGDRYSITTFVYGNELSKFVTTSIV
jgi:predicted 2-oxoglutarate/Fe(II)-dependent dioxygenase YbiX